eukprot:5171254-Prymnesium_polylepis.1
MPHQSCPTMTWFTPPSQTRTRPGRTGNAARTRACSKGPRTAATNAIRATAPRTAAAAVFHKEHPGKPTLQRRLAVLLHVVLVVAVDANVTAHACVDVTLAHN